MKFSLTEQERQSFSLISDAIRANPFAKQRASLDAAIAGKASKDPRTTLEHAARNATLALEHMVENSRARTSHYQGRDRELVENLILFQLFHSYAPGFDQHIQDQIQHGDQPLRLRFGAELLQRLISFGFTADEAERYLAVFFQMRRGFYFIKTNLLGSSRCMRELRCALWNSIFTLDIDIYYRRFWNRMEDFSTLLLGETGTGKGVAAAAIGRSGFIPYDCKKQQFKKSFTEAFVELNLSQFSEQLIESELFGHSKGAFTGAVTDHKGILSHCSSHGAILLDEIGEVPETLQIKLLRVLQERVFTAVGSADKKRFAGRVIGATNRSLDSLRGADGFRDDFFFRLTSDIITIPSLRQRLAEDPDELNALLPRLLMRISGCDAPEECGRIFARIQTVVEAAYSWPGNVRELEQCIRRMFLHADFQPRDSEGRQQLDRMLMDCNPPLSAARLMSRYCKALYQRFGTFQQVANAAELDRRTAKRYILMDDE